MHTQDKVVIFFVFASGISYFLDLHMACLLVAGDCSTTSPHVVMGRHILVCLVHWLNINFLPF